MKIPMTVTPGMRLHFIGIGGIGMSGLAAICLDRGCLVSGCDAKLGAAAIRLQEQGASVRIGHHPSHLDERVDLVVYSSAVSAREPERLAALSARVPMISRGELLALLSADRKLIAVAGAHGKTTTSGMAAQLLLETGWDPTIIVGGMMRSLGTNAHAGRGAYVGGDDEIEGRGHGFAGLLLT